MSGNIEQEIGQSLGTGIRLMPENAVTVTRNQHLAQQAAEQPQFVARKGRFNIPTPSLYVDYGL